MQNQSIETTFPKSITVFGVTVRGTAETPDANLIHAANILAQYLDNNGDGVPDNQAVVDKLASEKATLLVTRDQAQTDTVLNNLPEGNFQDLNAAEMNLNSAAGGRFDASLEEVLHLITNHGYAKVYPETFGETAGSAIANAMDIARGGHFTTVPASYPAGAWYTYDDQTCDYACQVAEYTYWGLTSILGAQSGQGRLQEIQQEWTLNTRALVESTDPALFSILTNPQFSLPTVIPDGNYQAATIAVGGNITSAAQDGTDGDDALTGNANANSITGTSGNDTIDGNGGNDTLRGEAGSDVINGGNGDDFVSAGPGADKVSGGAGADQIFAGANDDGNDTIIGGEGGDIIGGGAGSDLLIDDGTSSAAVSGLTAEGNALASDGADTLFGGAGNDTLIGNGFNDTSGNGTYDRGEEVTSSGQAANTLFAGTGDDFVFGAAGNDIIGGGTGDDTIEAGAGNDIIYGGKNDGADTGVNDHINAGNGDDQIFASGGNDSVSGGAGNDQIFTGVGTDTVDGGAGADTIYGGQGDDTFTGGAGADTFIFFANSGNDTVTDFSITEDALNLQSTTTDFTDVNSVQAATSETTVNGQSGIMIDTGGGNSIFLSGLSNSDLSNINIVS